MKRGGGETMSKLLRFVLLAALAASLSGCQTCRRIGGWFHRGDPCEPPAMACPPGVPRATMMMPTPPPGTLPTPIEYTPIN
jgi:hypothetical protein